MAGLGATAQVSLVNPVPQEVTVATENAIFDAPAAWSINAAKAHQNDYIYDALMTASPEVAKESELQGDTWRAWREPGKQVQEEHPRKERGLLHEGNRKGGCYCG